MEKHKILAIVGDNLKRLLNESGLSPTELTKKCDVSAGSLSKIMKGTMSITIPMAMEITEGLGTDISELLGGLIVEPAKTEASRKKWPAKTDQLSVGILSINNKRITCIKDYHGKIIGSSELEGGLDLAETASVLRNSIQESIFIACPKLNANQEKLKAIKLNLVTQSFEFEESRSKFTAFSERYFKEVMLLSDWQISYLSSFENGDGLSLIVDKGVSLSYKDNGKIKKLGGWKFPVYDLGGENWLGIETIKHTIEAKEGYTPMSDLAHNMLAKFNGKIEKITEFCFKRHDPDIYCFFTELLLRCYFIGDFAAKAIIERGFKLIYQMVDRADNIVGKKAKIALSGSLTDIYKSYFKKERLKPSSSETEKANLLADLTIETLAAHGVNNV